jgi:hypothetical protein
VSGLGARVVLGEAVGIHPGHGQGRSKPCAQQSHACAPSPDRAPSWDGCRRRRGNDKLLTAGG